MIGPVHPIARAMASGTLPSASLSAGRPTEPEARAPGLRPQAPPPDPVEPILCGHCGRTASNGISCQGICVADSGY